MDASLSNDSLKGEREGEEGEGGREGRGGRGEEKGGEGRRGRENRRANYHYTITSSLFFNCKYLTCQMTLNWIL